MRFPGTLEKLKITAHEVKRYDSTDPALIGFGLADKLIEDPKALNTFEVMFNPESYSLSYQNVYEKRQGINTSSKPAKYSLSKPQELSLTLILDDTGVVASGPLQTALPIASKVLKIKRGFEPNVYKKVEKFLELTNYMDGDTHEPKFLTVQWGELLFPCRLESVDVRYTLFNRSGNPLRAELDVVFVGDIADDVRTKLEKKNSPDLTHVRTVGSSDTLPLMASAIYQTPAYYIQLARANKLNNFRRLKTGSSIRFPPVKSKVQ